MTQIIIKILDKDAPPKRAKKPSLEERITHAMECMVCDINKADALKFLQAAQSHLDSLPRQTKEDQVLLEKIRGATSLYGHYHIQSKSK